MSTKAQRTTAIETLEQEFRGARGIYVTNINKINVQKVTRLRADLRKQGVRYIVIKNTLAKVACGRLGITALDPHFKGPTAVAVAKEDGATPAKIIRDFQKDNKDLLKLKAAYVDGTMFEGVDALRLADLPSREVLLAQLLGCLKAPMGNLAGALNGILSKLTLTLEAVKEQKSAAGQ